MAGGSIFAQKKVLNSAKNELKGKDPKIAEARNLIKEALANPETENQAETWFVAGQIENKQFDMENTKEMLGQEPNKAVMYEALGKIIPYYEKAYELDQLPDAKGKVKPKYTKDIQAIMMANRIHYINSGVFYYDQQKYQQAYENFKLYGDIPNLPMMEGTKVDGVVENDSTAKQIRYYAGLAASFIPDHKAAIEIYESIKDNGYEEKNIYRNLAYEYTQTEDSANLEKILVGGFEKFPEDEYFLLNLINLSIHAGKSDQAIVYLNEAINADPNNAQMIDVLGQVYEETKEYDKAINQFKKALEIDPNHADALSHLGRVYYNLGVEARGRADDNISNNKIFDEESKKSLDLFKQALPYFEKAYNLNKEDVNAIYALRNIYYNLGMDEFEKMDAIYTAKSGIEE